MLSIIWFSLTLFLFVDRDCYARTISKGALSLSLSNGASPTLMQMHNNFNLDRKSF